MPHMSYVNSHLKILRTRIVCLRKQKLPASFLDIAYQRSFIFRAHVCLPYKSVFKNIMCKNIILLWFPVSQKTPVCLSFWEDLDQIKHNQL